MASSSSVGNASLANASSAHAFYTHFRTATDSLLTRLSDAPTTAELVQQALQEHAGLSAELTKAIDSGVLPAHDQGVHKRRLEEVAAALEDKRRSVGQQEGQTERKKGGFTFKRKQPAAAAAVSAASVAASQSATVPTTLGKAPAADQDTQPSHLSVSAIHDARYSYSSTAQTLSSTSISIDVADISDSIVDLRSLASTHTVLAVQVRGVTHSALLLPSIEGSIMIHGVEDSLLSIPSCHQFRMHDSNGAVVELSTKRGSVVTIEGCKGVTFVTRVGETVKVQDFDDLINSEQLKQRDATGGSGGNFRVVQSSSSDAGDLARKVDVLSGTESSAKACVDRITSELDTST